MEPCPVVPGPQGLVRSAPSLLPTALGFMGGSRVGASSSNLGGRWKHFGFLLLDDSGPGRVEEIRENKAVNIKCTAKKDRLGQ